MKLQKKPYRSFQLFLLQLSQQIPGPALSEKCNYVRMTTRSEIVLLTGYVDFLFWT